MASAPHPPRSQGAVFGILWAVFFVHGLVSGLWIPALTNILNFQGLAAWVPVAFMMPPLGALIAPPIAGALADQRLPADRIYAYSSAFSGVFLALAFGALQGGWNPLWFIVLLGIQSAFTAPGWGLLAIISLTQLRHGESAFPRVRVGATIGWAAGGIATGYLLGMDHSPWAGQVSAALRLAAIPLVALLPHTPPLGRATDWRSRLGFGAFSLLRQRNTAVMFGVTAVFSIPFTAFYMYRMFRREESV